MIQLNPLEEIDVLIELQNPLFVYATNSMEEQIAFAKYINSLSDKRILLLGINLFETPFIIATLKENNIEAILREGGNELKKILFSNLSNPEFVKKVADFVIELDRRDKTTENSTRFKNILQYLRDNRFIV